MVKMDESIPGYGFAVHKGYSTRAHSAAMIALGPSCEHRMSYANVAAAAAGLSRDAVDALGRMDCGDAGTR